MYIWCYFKNGLLSLCQVYRKGCPFAVLNFYDPVIIPDEAVNALVAPNVRIFDRWWTIVVQKIISIDNEPLLATESFAGPLQSILQNNLDVFLGCFMVNDHYYYYNDHL